MGKPTKDESSGRRKKRRLWPIFLVLPVFLAVWVVTSGIWPKYERLYDGRPFFVVRRGPLIISVIESGTIKNREKAVVKNEVEGKTRILFIVPEGTHVRKGERLIQLDASSLEEQKTDQQITLLNKEAAYVHARENLSVTRSQVASDIAKAKLDYQFSGMDLQKYLRGEYPQDLQQAEAEITIAKEELQRAEDKLTWSQQLHEERYITRIELRADELAAKRKKLDVQLAQGRLKLLKQYTHRRKLKELESDLVQTRKALDRIKRKAAADIVQAEAELKAKESEFKRQTAKLEKINSQIAKCSVVAPVDGMVVYATTGQGSWRGNKEPLQEGQEIREGQELLHLPVTSSMMAVVKVHESSLMKVKQGAPVRIVVEAMPDKAFTGRVHKVALLPDAVMAWLNPDLKVFSTEIYLDGDGDGLRVGMTCRAEIIIAEYADVIYVPVQSVVRVSGKPAVYVVEPGGTKRRQVEIGMDNNRMIRIISGLNKGEKVLLAPPLVPSEAPPGKKRSSKGRKVISPQIQKEAPPQAESRTVISRKINKDGTVRSEGQIVIRRKIKKQGPARPKVRIIIAKKIGPKRFAQ